MRLDFSEFHPLDHSLVECRGYPGGVRRHLAYRWRFDVRSRVRRHIACRLGRHEWTVTWRRGAIFKVACQHCPAHPDPATAARLIMDARDNPPPRFDR